ncbi:MAG: DAK2 domain-containing protein [Clostridia bacterium]|nr:DAK2 domain-containing protein [Clostridia bacterium]
MIKTINGATFRKMIVAGASLLEQNKKYVDSLNVFPVPDGDTGTNMFLTMKSAVNEVSQCGQNTVEALSNAFAKGALKGARGNSGVITSQIFKGFCSETAKHEEITVKDFAKAMQEGANIAYKAVTKPKEGTILTVIRVMAENAVNVAKKHDDFESFLKNVLQVGEEILSQTPEMLPVLKKAGVVDAGGRGILVIFTGFYKLIMGEEDFEFKFEDEKQPQTMDDVLADIENLGEIEFGYCTEYMIINMHKKTTEADIDKLRDKLCALGDSVICIGDLNLVKVHVHSNEPNKALEYALELGELHNLKIENMREQNRELKKKANVMEESKEHGMIAVAPGDGIATIYRDLGVDEIIVGGQTMNPSAADIAAAADKVPARNVFVFPNNKNIVLAANQASDLTNKNIIVIPTRSIPEGISAAIAFNPDGSVEENAEAMNDAIKGVKSGSVTYAVRDTHVDGFDLHVGDIIGLDDKAILAKGKLVSETTETLIGRMISDETMTITLFYGEDIREDEANALAEKLTNKYPNCEVSAISGGQPVYYYLVSVE